MIRECPVYIKNGKVIDENMTTIEKILHSKKLNYKDLKEIADPYFKDGKFETVNLYIDLFDILKQMYSPMLIEDFKTIRSSTKMNIISELINIIGHYRHFFMSRYGKYSTILFYYSDKKDTFFTSIEQDYKRDFYDKRLLGSNNQEFYVVNKILNDCIRVVKEYLNYIPHAYVINTRDVDPRVFPYFMKHEITSEDTNNLINPDDFTIIMSNNKLSLIDLTLNDNTIIFRHNYKSRYFLNKEDIFDELNLDNVIGLPANYLKYLFSLSGSKEFNIPNVSKMREKKAFKYLCTNYTKDKDNMFSNLSEKDLLQFNNNQKIINPSVYPFSNYQKTNILNQFVDISDFEYIKQETFNTFDASCVVLLNYLYDGEEF